MLATTSRSRPLALVVLSFLSTVTLGLPSPQGITLPTPTNQNWTVTIGDETIPVERASAKRSLQKRGSQAITCAPEINGVQYFFNTSTCLRPGTQEWVCESYTIDPDEDNVFGNALSSEDLWDATPHMDHGRCGNRQICVDGLRPSDLPAAPLPTHPVTGEPEELPFSDPVAYCADIDDYIPITEGRMKKLKQLKTMTWHYLSQREEQMLTSEDSSASSGTFISGNHSAEVVFAGTSEDQVIVLSSISITAQSSTLDLSQGRKWTDLATQSCTKCNAIGFDHVPEHTSRFLISPIYPADVNVGTAYLWSM